MVALTWQVPSLPDVIVTTPDVSTEHAPPDAPYVMVVPPGEPVTWSGTVLPYCNDDGGGGLNVNVTGVLTVVNPFGCVYGVGSTSTIRS